MINFKLTGSRRYDRDPHFPRDAKRLSLSPIKLRSTDSVTAAAAAANSAKAAEPNVDFEFLVNIFINSGKCLLHTPREEERSADGQGRGGGKKVKIVNDRIIFRFRYFCSFGCFGSFGTKTSLPNRVVIFRAKFNILDVFTVQNRD